METYKTFLKNNRAVLIGHIFIYAQGIILMPIIIKTAGIAIYGGYILVSAMVGFIYGISSFGVGFKNSRFLPGTEGREDRSAIFYPQFCFQFLSIIIFSLIFVLFYPLLDNFLFKGEFTFTKWLVFPFLIFYFLYSQITSYFLSTHRVSHFNYATAALPYLNICFVILIYLFIRKLSVNILFSTQILSYIILTALLAPLFFREIGLKLVLPGKKNLIDDIKLGFPLRINYVMDFILGSSDRYLITYFLTVAAVGYYNPGYALGSLIIFFPKVSGAVLTPLLAKAVDSRQHLEAQNMLNYTIMGFLIMAIPFIVGSAVLSKPLLYLFANADVSQQAYLVTPVVAVATLFFGLNVILSNALWVKMKTVAILKMNMLAAVINMILNIMFLYFFKNVLVAAFSTLISYFIVFIFVCKVVMKDWVIKFRIGVIVKSIIASVFMGVVLCFMSSCAGSRAYKIWFILGTILLGILIYITLIFVMKIFTKKEIEYLKACF